MFSTPCYHPKSKPFVDHILSFSIEDNRVWFRNFQVRPNSHSVNSQTWELIWSQEQNEAHNMKLYFSNSSVIYQTKTIENYMHDVFGCVLQIMHSQYLHKDVFIWKTTCIWNTRERVWFTNPNTPKSFSKNSATVPHVSSHSYHVWKWDGTLLHGSHQINSVSQTLFQTQSHITL